MKGQSTQSLERNADVPGWTLHKGVTVQQRSLVCAQYLMSLTTPQLATASIAIFASIYSAVYTNWVV